MSDTTFKDINDHKWDLKLTLLLCEKIRKKLGVRLSSADSVNELQAIRNDRAKFAELLWVMLKKQAENSSVSKDDFLGAMDGDTLDQAISAFDEAFVLSCAQSTQAAVRQVIKKQTEAVRAAADAVVARLDSPGFSAAVDAEIQDCLDRCISAISRGARE